MWGLIVWRNKNINELMNEQTNMFYCFICRMLYSSCTVWWQFTYLLWYFSISLHMFIILLIVSYLTFISVCMLNFIVVCMFSYEWWCKFPLSLLLALTLICLHSLSSWLDLKCSFLLLYKHALTVYIFVVMVKFLEYLCLFLWLHIFW